MMRFGRPVNASWFAWWVSSRFTSSRSARSLANAATTKLVTTAMTRKICSVTTWAAPSGSANGPRPNDVATFAPTPTTKPAAAAARVPKRMPTQINSVRMRYGTSDRLSDPKSANVRPVATTTRTAAATNSLRVRCTSPRVVYVTSNGTTIRTPRPSETIHSTHASVHGRSYPTTDPMLPIAPPIIGPASTALTRNSSNRRPRVIQRDDSNPSRISAATAGSTQLPSNHHAAGPAGATPRATPSTVGTLAPAMTHPHRRIGSTSIAASETPAGGQKPATVSDGSPLQNTANPNTRDSPPTTKVIVGPDVAANLASDSALPSHRRARHVGVAGHASGRSVAGLTHSRYRQSHRS